jgi:hypothetical protein
VKKRIKEYVAYIDALIESGKADDWGREIEKHLTQIAFFAHERLVHLIVFCLVAICTVMSIIALVVSGQIVLLPLIIMLFVLLIPYCMHYYLLENSVQHMYRQYDKMLRFKEGVDKAFSESL